MDNSDVFSSFNFFMFQMQILHFYIEICTKSLSESIFFENFLSNELLKVTIEQLWGLLAQNLNFVFWNLNSFKTSQDIFGKNDLPLTCLQL